MWGVSGGYKMLQAMTTMAFTKLHPISGILTPKKTKAKGLFSFWISEAGLSLTHQGLRKTPTFRHFYQGSKDANLNHHDMSLYSKINGKNTSQVPWLVQGHIYIYKYIYIDLYDGSPWYPSNRQQQILYCRQ